MKGYPTTSEGEDTLAGPTPAGGGTVSDLYADEQLNDALVGTETNVVKIIDNTTGVTLLECTVTAARITATGNKFSGSAKCYRRRSCSGW